MQPAIFLDRDGVLIENRSSYVRTWADVEIYPQALKALAQLSSSPYKIVIITNQAGIGKGLIRPETAQDINSRLVSEVASAGGRVDAVYVCPHRPEEACSCRKPAPGLLLAAAQDLHIDLSQSIMIGDSLNDLRAGKAAGVKKVSLVRTGLGAAQSKLPEAAGLQPFSIYDDLSQALSDLTD